MSAPLRLFIADDHPGFRSGLAALLDSEPGLEVIGEAADGPEAVEQALALRPDVVLMDLDMPGFGGVEATRRITDGAADIAVLVVTMLANDESVVAALRAGARGYVVKEAEVPEIVSAVQAVARGDAIFGGGIAQRVLEAFSTPGAERSDSPFPELTERELEVLDLMALGASNDEISRRLGISPKTVRNHVSSILTKLRVVDRTRAVLRARDAGLGQEA